MIWSKHFANSQGAARIEYPDVRELERGDAI